MSSEKLIANELLAFLQNQLDVMDEISVTQICTSNFTEAEIRSGKALLYESIGMTDRMPSRRRDDKGVKSLQDIIKMLKETDPDDVPTFVAKELRKLPPVTFDHVDVTRLLKDIVTLKASLAEVQFKLEASQNTISELRTEIVELRNVKSVCRSHESTNLSLNCGVNTTSQSSAASANLAIPAAVSTACNASPRPAPHPAGMTSPAAHTSSSSRAYASVAASRTPIQNQRQVKKTLGLSKTERKTTAHTVSRKGELDMDGFITVERKKRKPTSRNQCGTALTGPNMLLRPATPTTQLYVSRLHYTTKAEQVVEYVQKKTNTLLRVVKLESSRNVNFNSFVIRVPTEMLATFTKEEFWPKGVVFRRFRGRLRDTTKQCTTSPSLRGS
ncbi:hypothetical protein ABMA27_004887 [Loxostege sticticalis]|uniref:Mutant cadherin n=1 Tax=Loxostege sticticalis TaxID=481309 RepID=A0ABR3HL05_LOXSC